MRSTLEVKLNEDVAPPVTPVSSSGKKPDLMEAFPDSFGLKHHSVTLEPLMNDLLWRRIRGRLG
jgi:hypothetical protein